MTKEIIYTKKAPEPIGPYSQAIKIDVSNSNLIYTAGLVGIDPATGSVVEGGIKAQTRRALDSAEGVLAAAGTDLTRVIKTTVFLKDMNDFALMNEVYAEYFNDAKPARSTIEVARLPKDALVEIEMIAYI